ncbi:MAG: hypothetical protein IJA78_03330 [Clostridia bacterium]|nr:hypothetical protein [Clostridia bacterium]
MYIQPHRDSPLELPVTVPRDYSGHTFRAPPTPPPRDEPPPEEQVEVLADAPSVTEEAASDPQAAQPDTAEAAPCGGTPQEKGFLSRIPLLSSLLPPKRSGKHEGELPEWAIIGLVLILLTDETSDILPFLLLLLLWD